MEPIIIGIAGGSGSGKSTFTNRLRQYFGDDVVVIYHDNYYRRQDGIPFEQRVKVNYDHPDSLETDLLVEHLKELKAGKTIECPVYDYSQHNRSSEIIKIEPRPIILVEGILLLADERIRSLLDIKVYVEADADERILRRIVRDVEERGRDLKGIITHHQHNTDNRRSSHIHILFPALSSSCPIFETNRSNATSFFPLLITISARALVGSTYM